MRRYEIPSKHAYFDGTRYYCYNADCLIDRATLKEIDRIPMSNSLTYIPILRCSECGATYFGLITRDLEAEQEITEYAQRVKRDEEERAKIAEQDNAEALAEIREKEAKQEQALQEETDRHSAEKNGDIILPNILTL